jgi:hypothetical protein
MSGGIVVTTARCGAVGGVPPPGKVGTTTPPGAPVLGGVDELDGRRVVGVVRAPVVVVVRAERPEATVVVELADAPAVVVTVAPDAPFSAPSPEPEPSPPPASARPPATPPMTHTTAATAISTTFRRRARPPSCPDRHPSWSVITLPALCLCPPKM